MLTVALCIDAQYGETYDAGWALAIPRVVRCVEVPEPFQAFSPGSLNAKHAEMFRTILRKKELAK